jgi:opacity protein-like surface antigen
VRLRTLVVLAVVALARPAEAQIFGQLTGAEPIATDARLFGAYLQTSENQVGLLGQLRLSFYPNIDFGFQGGLQRVDYTGGDRSLAQLGADVRFGLGQQAEGRFLSSSIDGAIGLESGDDYHTLTLGLIGAVSHRFPMGENSGITPYAGLGVAFQNAEIGDNDNSDMYVPLRLGASFKIGAVLDAITELQFRLSDDVNDDLSLVFGANFPF